jgi:hypothetical protein
MTLDDSDNDGIIDSVDNCPFDYNPEQADTNSNGIGDACDEPTDIDDYPEIFPLPEAFSLSQNYPNPFNPATNIRFNLSQTQSVTLAIFNILGEKVKTLIDSRLPAGEHAVKWDGTDSEGHLMPTGIYFYRLKADESTETRKMIFVK